MEGYRVYTLILAGMNSVREEVVAKSRAEALVIAAFRAAFLDLPSHSVSLEGEAEVTIQRKAGKPAQGTPSQGVPVAGGEPPAFPSARSVPATW